MTTCVKTRARGKRPVLPPCPKEVTTSRGYDSVFSLFFYYDRNVGKTQLPWLTMHAAPSHAPHTPHPLPSTTVVPWRAPFAWGWATSGAWCARRSRTRPFATRTCYVGVRVRSTIEITAERVARRRRSLTGRHPCRLPHSQRPHAATDHRRHIPGGLGRRQGAACRLQRKLGTRRVALPLVSEVLSGFVRIVVNVLRGAGAAHASMPGLCSMGGEKGRARREAFFTAERKGSEWREIEDEGGGGGTHGENNVREHHSHS